MGSGPTCHLAEKISKKSGKRFRGVILQSPLLSIYRVAFDFRFSMPGDIFCNVDKIKNIKSPIFVIHGRRDEIVPFWHGSRLYNAIDPKFRFKPWWIDGGGHNNIEKLLEHSADNILHVKFGEFVAFCRQFDFEADDGVEEGGLLSAAAAAANFIR